MIPAILLSLLFIPSLRNDCPTTPPDTPRTNKEVIVSERVYCKTEDLDQEKGENKKDKNKERCTCTDNL